MDVAPIEQRKMKRCLVDSNHIGACLHPTSRLRDRIRLAIRSGSRVATCVPVLCEVHVFVEGSRDRDQRAKFLREILHSIRIWPVEVTVAPVFASLYHNLESRGRKLSQVDLMLAAMAIQMNCTLLTTDRDFEALPELKCENWLI